MQNVIRSVKLCIINAYYSTWWPKKESSASLLLWCSKAKYANKTMSFWYI